MHVKYTIIDEYGVRDTGHDLQRITTNTEERHCETHVLANKDFYSTDRWPLPELGQSKDAPVPELAK